MFKKSEDGTTKVPEHPAVLAKMLEVHHTKVAKVREIHAIKMRAANARKHAVAHAKLVQEHALQIAQQVAVVKAAHAAAAQKQIALLQAQFKISAR